VNTNINKRIVKNELIVVNERQVERIFHHEISESPESVHNTSMISGSVGQPMNGQTTDIWGRSIFLR